MPGRPILVTISGTLFHEICKRRFVRRIGANWSCHRRSFFGGQCTVAGPEMPDGLVADIVPSLDWGIARASFEGRIAAKMRAEP
jgi:hypothetical protein